MPLSRRDFVQLSLAAAFAGALPAGSLAQGRGGEMQFRTLGRTGERVSIVGVGGFHIGIQQDENESVRIIHSAIDAGVNFMDNCWDYNGGESEIRMGKALRGGHRQKVFLMTKIDGHDQASAARQIDESLRRLQTDHLDLLQFHEVIRMSDPEHIFAANGAIHAALDARQAGKVRFIGFTGHKSPEIHLHMLEVAGKNNFRFDTVQMPLNVMDAHFDSFEKKVLPVAVKDGLGILGMKPFGDDFVLQSKTVTPVEALHYAMNLPTSVVITGIDSMQVLHQDLEAARSFRPLTEQQVSAILGKTVQAAHKGNFEPYKTSHQFDGTYHNPQWLGSAGA